MTGYNALLRQGMQKMMIDTPHIDWLSNVVGTRGVITDQSDMQPYVTEWRDKFIGNTPLVLMPSSTRQVSEILAYCNAHHIAVVPQGGNTGLVGGGIPGLEGSEEVLLSSRRLTSDLDVDAEAYKVVAQAGVPIANIQEAAASADRLFALSLASEGSCTAGGIVATNAGGVHVIRYGTARDLMLGIEAVLPDGTVVNELSGLRKDNTGYAMSHLLAGSEGTLGFITRVCFKLFPSEKSRSTAWLAIDSPTKALELLSMAREICEDQVSVYELMCREALDFAYRHIPGCKSPIQSEAPWVVLIEAASAGAESSVSINMDKLLDAALARSIISDGAIAQSLEQRKQFWRNRESLSEAQKLEGGSIKHDISVPLSKIPTFIQRATAEIETSFRGARVTPFGHLGDGNLHFNVMQPVGGHKARFLQNWEKMNQLVHNIVMEHGGSISAEHGIGILKKQELQRTAPPAHLAAMRSVKRGLDPNNIMNPRCLFT